MLVGQTEESHRHSPTPARTVTLCWTGSLEPNRGSSWQLTVKSFALHIPLCIAVCINQNKTRSQMQPVVSGAMKVFHPEPSETVLNNALPLAISISARHRGPLHRKSRGKIIESIVLRKDCSFSPILVLTILQQG